MFVNQRTIIKEVIQRIIISEFRWHSTESHLRRNAYIFDIRLKINNLLLQPQHPGTNELILLTLDPISGNPANDDFLNNFSTTRWRHNERDGVSNHQPHDCLLNRLLRRRSKKTSKLRVIGLCEGNSPVTGEFPAQRASNAENVSIWWRHHVNTDLRILGQHFLRLSLFCIGLEYGFTVASLDTMNWQIHGSPGLNELTNCLRMRHKCATSN